MIRLELLYLYFASINVYDRYENSSSSLHRSDFLYSVDNPEHNHEDNGFVVVWYGWRSNAWTIILIFQENLEFVEGGKEK